MFSPGLVKLGLCIDGNHCLKLHGSHEEKERAKRWGDAENKRERKLLVLYKMVLYETILYEILDPAMLEARFTPEHQ